MSYELVIERSKAIEYLLSLCGAEGKGLFEKALSIESKLKPAELVNLKYIANVRNELVHGDAETLSEEKLHQFRQATTETKAILERYIIDESNVGKNGESIICPHCGKPSLTQSVEPNKELCVLCGVDINTMDSTPVAAKTISWFPNWKHWIPMYVLGTTLLLSMIFPLGVLFIFICSILDIRGFHGTLTSLVQMYWTWILY